MTKVGPNAVNFAIAEMIGQLLTLTTHPNGDMLKARTQNMSKNNQNAKTRTKVSRSKSAISIFCILLLLPFLSAFQLASRFRLRGGKTAVFQCCVVSTPQPSLEKPLLKSASPLVSSFEHVYQQSLCYLNPFSFE